MTGAGRAPANSHLCWGLMVWRDLDLTVACETLDVARVADTGARIGCLVGQPHRREVVRG